MAEPGETKLITCILHKGIAREVSEKLLKEKGIITGNINNARGSGHITAKKHQLTVPGRYLCSLPNWQALLRLLPVVIICLFYSFNRAIINWSKWRLIA